MIFQAVAKRSFSPASHDVVAMLLVCREVRGRRARPFAVKPSDPAEPVELRMTRGLARRLHGPICLIRRQSSGIRFAWLAVAS